MTGMNHLQRDQQILHNGGWAARGRHVARHLWTAGVLSLGLVLGGPTGAWAQSLLLHSFDAGKKPNALGGDFGCWNLDPTDLTQRCRDSFNEANAYGGVGYALRLDYDVDSTHYASNGYWSKLQDVDLRSYSRLSFYIKGDPTQGYPTEVKLELKNHQEVGRYTLQGITDQWQRVSIPLDAFKGLPNRWQMTQFVVVFDQLTLDTKVGTIYLDEIGFE